MNDETNAVRTPSIVHLILAVGSMLLLASGLQVATQRFLPIYEGMQTTLPEPTRLLLSVTTQPVLVYAASAWVAVVLGILWQIESPRLVLFCRLTLALAVMVGLFSIVAFQMPLLSIEQ